MTGRERRRILEGVVEPENGIDARRGLLGNGGPLRIDHSVHPHFVMSRSGRLILEDADRDIVASGNQISGEPRLRAAAGLREENADRSIDKVLRRLLLFPPVEILLNRRAARQHEEIQLVSDLSLVHEMKNRWTRRDLFGDLKGVVASDDFNNLSFGRGLFRAAAFESEQQTDKGNPQSATRPL